MKVESILKRKGTNVLTIRPGATVGAAARELRAHGVGALVITDDEHAILGILSERHIVHGLAVYGVHVMDLRVSDLMEPAVVTCAPDDSITHVMAEMTRHRVRHLPVVEDRRLSGIVSIGDVVKYRVDELETEANILREVFIARH